MSHNVLGDKTAWDMLAEIIFVREHNKSLMSNTMENGRRQHAGNLVSHNTFAIHNDMVD